MSLRVPSATYRLQLTRDFGFYDAAAIAGYLKRLGISDLYVSPIFKAAPGSTHGYDVLDHQELNPELGGAAGFQALCDGTNAHELTRFGGGRASVSRVGHPRPELSGRGRIDGEPPRAPVARRLAALPA